MKRLRTLSIARPDALMRNLLKSAWGEAYWRGVRLSKRRDRERRQLRQLRQRLLVKQEVTYGQELPEGTLTIEMLARTVH